MYYGRPGYRTRETKRAVVLRDGLYTQNVRSVLAALGYEAEEYPGPQEILRIFDDNKEQFDIAAVPLASGLGYVGKLEDGGLFAARQILERSGTILVVVYLNKRNGLGDKTIRQMEDLKNTYGSRITFANPDEIDLSDAIRSLERERQKSDLEKSLAA